jgi:hypothetical protein
MPIRFIYLNRWRSGVIINHCSEHPQNPAEDTQIDSQSYFWRTRYGTGAGNGLFVVDATCNKINFDEGGAELTGTVASASYNGNALATAVAAALNGAAGKALTYACVYSESTGKFTISAGANFTLRWLNGTNKTTDISDLCGYLDTANDTGAATYTSDNRRIHWPKAFIDIDLLTACEANFIGLLGHNISSAAVIKLYGADDTAFTTNLTTDTITWALGSIYFFLSASRTKRYYRVSIEDPTNTGAYIQISTISLGKYFEPSRNYIVGGPEGPEDLADLGLSDSLNLYGQEKPMLDTWDLPFDGLSNAEKAEVRVLNFECGLTKALIICFDSSSPNTTSYLVGQTETEKPVPNHLNNWSWTGHFREFV